MLPTETLAEVVAFLVRFDLAPVSLASKQLHHISEKHASNLCLWKISYAFVRSCWQDMHSDFHFIHEARDERFSVDRNTTKRIIPIVMRNVVVEQCFFQCIHAVKREGCILGAYSEIADRIAVTGSLDVLGKCINSTKKLLEFLAKFRSVKALNISSYGGVQFDIDAIRGFCKRKSIESCIVDRKLLFITK